MQCELFGQIVSLEHFGDTADALAMAKTTRYRLGAPVYTTHMSEGPLVKHGSKTPSTK